MTKKKKAENAVAHIGVCEGVKPNSFPKRWRAVLVQITGIPKPKGPITLLKFLYGYDLFINGVPLIKLHLAVVIAIYLIAKVLM